MPEQSITAVRGRSILDSRGYPTVEATVTAGEFTGVASVPSGASTGEHEAKELRDADRRWNGKGVSRAVSHVSVELAGALKGMPVTDHVKLDATMRELDGTEDKSRLGANALLAVSLAAVQAAAKSKQQQVWQYVGARRGQAKPSRLPVPMCNLINGGEHADNSLDIQEFMVVPHGFDTFAEALRAAAETFHALAPLLTARRESTSVGAEGGYAPNLSYHTDALDLLVEAIKRAGYQPGSQISLALDVAASTFYRDGRYVFERQALTSGQLAALYASLVERYPLFAIEDPVAEDDWEGWTQVRERLADHPTLIVGDDLTVTNPERLDRAIAEQAITGMIIKPNQIGTYTEAEQAAAKLAENDLAGIASHRSGETTDDTIADLAVGWGTPLCKFGSFSRWERVVKYNRLLAIEQHIGSQAEYAGKLFTNHRRHYGTT